jgi:hypothetical protein
MLGAENPHLSNGRFALSHRKKCSPLYIRKLLNLLLLAPRGDSYIRWLNWSAICTKHRRKISFGVPRHPAENRRAAPASSRFRSVAASLSAGCATSHSLFRRAGRLGLPSICAGHFHLYRTSSQRDPSRRTDWRATPLSPLAFKGLCWSRLHFMEPQFCIARCQRARELEAG